MYVKQLSHVTGTLPFHTLRKKNGGMHVLVVDVISAANTDFVAAASASSVWRTMNRLRKIGSFESSPRSGLTDITELRISRS